MPVAAQDASPQDTNHEAGQEEVTSFTLDNGLEVVVIEDHRAPAVVHMVWYRVGAADEPPGKSGIAHFLEHLMFKGTDTRAVGEFSAVVEAQGGSDNAFTSWDYTGYFQRVAADRLDLMMEMEADRMANLRLDEPEVLTERDVVLEERNQVVEGRPGAIFREIQRATLFMNHPYRLPIIGWRDEIAALSREDALDFYSIYYAPNNAVLVVAGDVTPDEVRALAETHYGPIAPSDALPPRLRPQEPPQRAERRFTYADPRVSEPFIARSYLAPARRSGAQEDAAALTVLAELLGGNPATSVLGRRLQFEQEIALGAYAGYGGVAVDDATFEVGLVPLPGVSLEEAEAAMDEVIEEFLAEGVDDAQLARVKTQIRASEIYARDNAQGLARRYGEALSVGLTVDDVRDWPAILEAVTAEDVMAAAEAVFDRTRAVTGMMVQAEGAAPLAPGSTPLPLPEAEEMQ
ncbi:M16 family metallopeptidase [Halodurantibacterium flavum]|uniref:M16 family metallopeptidase n=1 Tax=Halodurantibacterium flavum TaxID=1382802 RepID=A0ABW4S4Z2_9RHOB